jgi:hypothetical protein
MQDQPTGSNSSSTNLQQTPGKERPGAGAAIVNSSSSQDSKQLLTKQVQLLVSEYLAKHRLKQLQAKQAAVAARRDQLLATKAQLELKQLRK